MDKRGVVKKLFNDYIVAEVIEVDNITGGLYAPKMQREEKYEKLKVVQGDKDVSEGDTILVIYGKGTSVQIDKKDYVLISKNWIISIL